MRTLLVVLISFQMISGPVAAELGESKELSLKQVTIEELAKESSSAFSKDVRIELEKIEKMGLQTYVQKSENLKDEDKKLIASEIKHLKASKINPFKESSRGQWEIKVGPHLLTYSLTDIYLQQLVINGEIFSYKGKTLAQSKLEILQILNKKKATSSIEALVNFHLPSAYAMEPISAVVIVALVAIVLGTTVYYAHFKPRKTVEKIKATAQQLKARADTCENAASTRENYDSTYQFATNISERTLLNSATSAENALQLHLKKQLEGSGAQANGSSTCGQAVGDALRSIGIDAPGATELERSQNRREAMGRPLEADSETDINGAMMGLCSTYNRLQGCMDQFVRAHTNDGGIGNFKDDELYNYTRYKVRAGVQGQ